MAPRTTRGDRSPEQERQEQRDPERATQVERAERAEVDGADRHGDREERDRGQRDPEVGEPHEQLVGPAAVEAGERPDHHADDGRQDRDAERDLQRDLPTVQHPRTTSRLKWSVPNQCADDGPAVGSSRCCAGSARSAHHEAGEHHEHEKPERHHRGAVTEATQQQGRHRLPAPRPSPRREHRVEVFGTGACRLVADPHAHARASATGRALLRFQRTRGSSTPYRMSATRLNEDDEDRGDRHPGQQNRIVGSFERGEEQQAEARPAEDLLDHDDAAEQHAGVDQTKSSLPSTSFVLLIDAGVLLGGVVVIEKIFNWPGMGLLFFTRSSDRTTR